MLGVLGFVVTLQRARWVAFMLEHDVLMYTRRAKHWQLNLGDSPTNTTC